MDNNFKVQRPEQVINVRQRDHRKAVEHLCEVKLHPGQSLWELNTITQEIKPATYDITAVNLDGGLSSQVFTKKDHLYCVAINEKNATRKFILMCKKITADARTNAA